MKSLKVGLIAVIASAFLSSCGFLLGLIDVPAVPAGLHAIAGDGQVALDWRTATGAKSYSLYYREGASVSTSMYDHRISDIGQTTYTVTDLENGTEYAFIVTATNSNGDSAASSIVTSTPTTAIVAEDITGTWFVTEIPSGWMDKKLVVGATSLQFYWEELEETDSIVITPDAGSTSAGRIQGTVTARVHDLTLIGATQRILYAVSGSNLTITWADSSWAPKQNASLSLSRTAPSPEIALVSSAAGPWEAKWDSKIWGALCQAAIKDGKAPVGDVTYAVPSADDDTAYSAKINALVASGVKLIVAPGFRFATVVAAAAAANPSVKFLLLDSYVNAPNVSSTVFATEEGSYLAGIAAAMKAKVAGFTKVGFIGGMDTDVITPFYADYYQGVHSVDQTLQVLKSYVGDFADPDMAAALAAAQFASGAGVIYAAAGASGDGIIQAAKDLRVSDALHPRWVIGVDISQYWAGIYQTSPEKSVVLTSMVKEPGAIAYNIVYGYYYKSANDPFGELWTYRLTDKAMTLPENNADLTSDIVAAVNAAKAAIVADTLSVQASLTSDSAAALVVVQGTQTWQASGVSLAAGENFSILASAGPEGGVNIATSSADPYYNAYYGPAGLPDGETPADLDAENAASYPMPSVAGGALVGRVGSGSVFLVGTGGNFTSDSAGELYLVVNDVPLTNNDGTLVVEIEK